MEERRRRQSIYREKFSALSLYVGEIDLSTCPWNGRASPQPEAVRSYLRPWPFFVLSTLSLVTGIISVRGGEWGRTVSVVRLRSLLISRTGLVGGLLRGSLKGLPWFLGIWVFGFWPWNTSQGRAMINRPGRTWFWGRRFLLGFITLSSLIEDPGN